MLTQPGDHDELQGPAESVDWYTFLEGGYPWLLLTHEERRELLARGVTPEAGAFDLSAWERVTTLADFLRRNSVEVRRFLGSDKGKVLPEKVLDHRSPRNRLHAKAYLFSGEMGRYCCRWLQQPHQERPVRELRAEPGLLRPGANDAP